VSPRASSYDAIIDAAEAVVIEAGASHMTLDAVAAKAGVSNFTEWLAVHMSQNYSTEIRVNAIAPGFFLTEQNRFLVTEEKTGNLTARGKSIVGHTPMARLGDPSELISAIVWLLGDGAKFVHGTVVAIDGGFNAFSGV